MHLGAQQGGRDTVCAKSPLGRGESQALNDQGFRELGEFSHVQVSKGALLPQKGRSESKAH